MPRIQQINVHVLTTNDNKEDSRFELDIAAGNENIFHLEEGAGVISLVKSMLRCRKTLPSLRSPRSRMVSGEETIAGTAGSR